MIGSLMVVTSLKSRILINSEKSVMCKIGSSPSSSNTSTNNRNSGYYFHITFCYDSQMRQGYRYCIFNLCFISFPSSLNVNQLRLKKCQNPDNLCILVVLDHNIRHNSEFDIFTIPPFRLKYENFLCIYVAKFQ